MHIFGQIESDNIDGRGRGGDRAARGGAGRLRGPRPSSNGGRLAVADTLQIRPGGATGSRRPGSSGAAAWPLACGRSRWSTSRSCSSCRSGRSSGARSRTASAPVVDALTAPRRHARLPGHAHGGVWCGACCNTIFGVVAAILLVRHEFPGKRLLNALIDLPMAVSPVVVGLALILVYGRFAAGRRLARVDRDSRSSSRMPGMVIGDDLRLAAAGGARGRAGARGDRHRAGAGGPDAGRRPVADVPAHHAAGHPVGARLRRRAAPGPRRSASTARSRWCRAGSSARPRP